MTNVTTDEMRAVMRAQLQAAFDSFEGHRRDFFELLNEVRTGETARAKKLGPVMSDLAKCATVVLTQYDKFQAMQDVDDSDGHKTDLDLAAARAEIGRRLTRLRTAGG